MTRIDEIAAANGINTILTKQQAKQAGLVKEVASGHHASSVAEAVATEFETEETTIPVVQKNIALAESLLATSNQALSSVASNLTKAMTVAAEAESATPGAKTALLDEFNDLLDQTKGYVNNAGINGQTLVGQHSQPLTVNTTTEGGKLTIANMAADANSLGVENVAPSGWNSLADIQAAINQIRNALNRITSLQSRFSAAMAALSAAAGLNETAVLAASSTAAALVGADVGAAVLDEKKSLAQVELGTWSSHHIHRHGPRIHGLGKK